MSVNKPSLTAIGATHLDETARLGGPLHPGTSNPVTWTRSIGGVAANVVRAASHWIACSLIGALGDDSTADSIRHYFSTTSIDIALQSKSAGETGRYTVVLDQQGELVLGLSATSITEWLCWDHILNAMRARPGPDMLVIDANLSAPCIHEICLQKTASRLAAIAVSPAKSMRLVDHAAHIDLLFANRAEASTMTGLSRTSPLQDFSAALTQMDFHQHVLTDGARSLLVTEGDHPAILLPVAPTTTAAGVNGAGDALAGATLAGWLLKESLRDSVVRYGLPAARDVLSGISRAPTIDTRPVA